MKFKDLFTKWRLTKVNLNLKIAELEFTPNAADEEAAWEMYVELITRVTTQNLYEDSGDGLTALRSIYSLFAITRDILKNHGRDAKAFTKIVIIVLNQVIRPFTAKWHKHSLDGLLDTQEGKKQFRQELDLLQIDLREYCGMLAEIAQVENLAEFIND
jgi:hypothetical protein